METVDQKAMGDASGEIVTKYDEEDQKGDIAVAVPEVTFSHMCTCVGAHLHLIYGSCLLSGD